MDNGTEQGVLLIISAGVESLSPLRLLLRLERHPLDASGPLERRYAASIDEACRTVRTWLEDLEDRPAASG